MTVKKVDTGWRVDVQPGGRGSRRIRRTFPTKGEAERFRLHVSAQQAAGQPWNPSSKDKRRLSDLAQTWFNIHGRHLDTGEERLTILKRTALEMGDPLAVDFTAANFSGWAEDKLSPQDESRPLSTARVNRIRAYWRSVFNELTRIDKWDGSNPLRKVRNLKERDPDELRYLEREELAGLFAEFEKGQNPDTSIVTEIALRTGARWSEAEGLTLEQIGKDRVTFKRTKGGKVRVVPLDPKLCEKLRQRPAGALFRPCYDSFRNAINRAGITLPAGQLTHVCRHTFASAFIQNGGDILTLQKLLGHGSIKMTMRYAHLAPDHLEEARRLNPVDTWLTPEKD